MDSDEERMREEEMSKLRSGSSSPSALSTASSGSPLVRGSSASKRPAPTSIAAAQLQCQQQQQQRLEFNNRLMTAGGKKTKVKRQAASGLPLGANTRIDWPTMSEEKMASANVKLAAEKLAESEREDNKSFGYNLAKSIAFRAYRFNEFWSVNKMRYMNLACLLMTLVCLITILLFSSSNNSNNNMASISAVNSAIKQRLEPSILARKNQLVGDEASETVDSLDSQPLVGSSTAQQVSAASANENLFDDFNLFDDHRGAKFRRKSEITSNGSNGAKPNAVEREIEDSTGGSRLGESSDFDRQKELSKVDQLPSDLSNSLIDPILSQFINDMEIPSLFKAIRRASNGTTNGEPVIRRSKNGATIIISRSFNKSALNDSSSLFPSLIEKLLPPFFRPISLSGNPTKPSDGSSNSSSGDSSSGTYPNPSALATGMATITIGSEPIFAASSPLGLTRLSPFMMDPFSAGYHSQQASRAHSPNLFMEPMGFRSPFGPMLGPSPMAMPHPSLMSMIMRANQVEPEEDGLSFSRNSVNPQAPLAILTGSHDNKPDTKNDTLLIAQASQISNQTAVKPDPPKSYLANESEVETLDVSHLARPNRMHNFYPRPRPAGSMLIFSSGGPNTPRDPFQFPFGSSMSPFMTAMPPPPPQMMFVGGGGSSGGEGPSNGLLNPILRTILNNVMSDLSPVSEVDKNKTERNQQARAKASSNIVPNWTALSGDLDEDWAGGSEGDRWDEHAQSKQLRARHRDDDMDPNADASEFVTGIQMDHAPSSPLASVLDRQLESGVVSGTIRQTIRGPGMTVERIIEVPSNRVQQVGPGIRSQSLSRADFEDTSESTLTRPAIPTSSIFSRQANERMSNDDSFAPHVGFIGKLLSDISRRSEQSSGYRSGPLIRNRSIDSEDFDEGDSGEILAPLKSPSTWPKIRVASARIRMRPMTEIRSAGSTSDALFMPPSHFNVPENGDISSEKESGLNENKLSSTFEDTMNSMEDRLNHVLSMASHQTLAPNHKPNNDEGIIDTSNKSGGGVSNQVPVASLARGIPTSNIASQIGQLEMKQTPLSVDPQPKQSQPENPFTSPSSPLFGFPASTISQSSSDLSKNKLGSSNNSASSTNRQQRSFTYHSNNEVASPNSLQNGANTQKRDQLVAVDSVSRARYIPLVSPPASVIMGRRLDDLPFHETNSNQGPDYFSKSALRPDLKGRKLFGEGRFLNQAVPNENYRTIVV